jgi:hypothetical protein
MLWLECTDFSASSIIYFATFFMAYRFRLVQCLFIVEASRSLVDTPHSVGLLWKFVQSNTETCTLQHNTHKKQAYVPPTGLEPASERPHTRTIDRIFTLIDTFLYRGSNLGNRNKFQFNNRCLLKVAYWWWWRWWLRRRGASSSYRAKCL